MDKKVHSLHLIDSPYMKSSNINGKNNIVKMNYF